MAKPSDIKKVKAKASTEPERVVEEPERIISRMSAIRLLSENSYLSSDEDGVIIVTSDYKEERDRMEEYDKIASIVRSVYNGSFGVRWRK